MTVRRDRSARHRRCALLVAAGMFVFHPAANAAVTIFGYFPVTQLLLSVGTGGTTINTVSMDVPAGDVGDPAKPIAGAPVIRLYLVARAPVGSPNFDLVVDSSTPLSSGSNSIPMSEIEWSSSDGSIPGGRFDNSSNQLVLSAQPDRLVLDYLTFRYRNSTVPAAGTYTGRVRFTLSVP